MNYRLHDVSRFPFVALREEECVAGYAADWGREMDALLAAGKPFVVAFAMGISETPEDYRERALWFKKNRGLLAGRCAAMVAIVPAAPERLAMADDLAKRSRGFGTRYLALESLAEAEAATLKLIAAINTAEAE